MGTNDSSYGWWREELRQRRQERRQRQRQKQGKGKERWQRQRQRQEQGERKGKGGSKVVVEPHRHEGMFIAKGKEDALCTLNLVPGESVYGEKRISVDGEDGAKTEYRIWNPFRSKIAAAVLGGIE